MFISFHRLALALAAAALPLTAQGRLRIQCPDTILAAGASTPCEALLDEDSPAGVVWSLGEHPGTITADGRYTAPALEASRLVRVRADLPSGAWAEAELLVLRDDPALGHLWRVMADLGEDALRQGFAGGGLPFLDPATGRRDREARVVVDGEEGAVLTRILGCGLAIRLAWAPELAAAEALQLAWQEGAFWVRRVVTGQTCEDLCLREGSRMGLLEALDAVDHRQDRWTSRIRRMHLRARGLVPHTAGAQDGAAPALRAPAGLASLPAGALAVADEAGHQVLRVEGSGRLRALAGAAGEAGFRDGAGAEARFRLPTFLASEARRPREGTPGLLVADTGNHAIRRIGLDGQVRTLAGDGVPGRVDADRGPEARFCAPQGLAQDPDGNWYVADAGNHAIRRIDPAGRVSTLAGSLEPGDRDGAGAQASFTALRGLAWWRGLLYAVDGHAIRTVTVDGEVRTVLGRVAEAGQTRHPRSEGPALARPWGLAVVESGLLVTEEGGHAVHRLRRNPLLPARHELIPLAGDAAAPDLRWGLLRAGRPWPLTEAYAALPAPRGVAGDGDDGAFVATGGGIARLSACEAPPAGPLIFLEPEVADRPEPATQGRPFHLMLPDGGPDLLPEDPVHRWILEVADAAGTVLRGPETLAPDPGRGLVFSHTFADPGAHEVRVTAVTVGGFSVSLALPVLVAAH